MRLQCVEWALPEAALRYRQVLFSRDRLHHEIPRRVKLPFGPLGTCIRSPARGQARCAARHGMQPCAGPGSPAMPTLR